MEKKTRKQEKIQQETLNSKKENPINKEGPKQKRKRTKKTQKVKKSP